MAILRYNAWGATPADLLQHIGLPGECSVAGGESAIQAFLEKAAREVALSMKDYQCEALTRPKYEIIVEFATAGQTTAATFLKPIVAGSLRMWRYRNPDCDWNEGMWNTWWKGLLQRPQVGFQEFTDYTLDEATGVVTFTVPLTKNDRVLVSYTANTEDETYVVASCADKVLDLAAADISIQLLDKDRAEYWRMKAKQVREDLQSGAWIAAELRHTLWWFEKKKTNSGLRSLRLNIGA